MSRDLSVLSGYPQNLISQVETLIEQNKLEFYLKEGYPERHNVRTDKALFSYVQEIQKTYLKKAGPIHKVLYDDRIESVHSALGLHSFVSRQQGNKLKSKNEIRISSLFKNAPAPFLHMIVVHELAHLKEKDHNKDFYRLCHHMEPDYSQLEFDLRLYMINAGI
ncbi:YgjP-like metallopeptidase domain-containing protein [Oceanispirochaeta sp.]|jgi:predicted metal-dependent hydrolase|uniref:M48 metallopeptidase family protein n=1 Tax=Oceanispirochaeta sp. TaxID=2035350 RepID=UPI00260CACBA|nr:YgjP-like metallopeptidase domain-containing protein [Oceanispirochaeta sp.]MDA3955398.1 DUF45 domain-containing protein [Oceanispirochaeta sp.]